MTSFGRFLERPPRELAQEAAFAAIRDAGLAPSHVQLLVYGNAMAGLITGQEMIRSEVVFGSTPLGGLPMVNVENACGSGSSAVHFAWLAIGSGQYDCVLVVGAEKLTHPEKAKTFSALSSAIDLDRQAELEAELSQGESGGAFMMDVYAGLTKDYMRMSGCTVDDLADVVVKNRKHATLNPFAQFRSEVTRQEVLGSRVISSPITLYMCSPIGDGAAAVLLCSEEFAGKLAAPSVSVRASAIATAVPGGTPKTPARRAAERAYEIAGIGPGQIDIVEAHDATAPAELMHLEELGLCGAGEAPHMLRAGQFSLGGRMPVNTSGGLIGRGHPVGATGCAQLVELTQQLRGVAGARQAQGVRVGIAENQGGYLHPDPAVAVVTILARD